MMHTNQQNEKIEAIVLRSQDYQERHRIISLYSPKGLITMIVKNISKKNTRLICLTSVFTYGEYLFSESKSSLLRFIDGSVIDEHLMLRSNFRFIQTAAQLSHFILATQLPNHSAPPLFLLYKSYLKQAFSFLNPTPLLTSFQLKLLHHEGLFLPSSTCLHCPNPSIQINEHGESVCSQHHSPHLPSFDNTEWDLLCQLYSAQSFSFLKTLSVSPPFAEKIDFLFKSILRLEDKSNPS